MTAESCKNCWASMDCTLCVKYADSDGVLSGKQRLTYCERVRNSTEVNLRKIILLRELDKGRKERG